MPSEQATGWGFLGAGGVARRCMLPAVCDRPETHLAAVMVRDQARAEAIANEFGAAAAYHRVDALLADPAVTAVYIATPLDTHRELVLAAAAAGKHILLEKPMALSVAEADEMLAAAADAGVRLAVCFPLRHTHAVRKLREWITAGELGELTYLRLQLAKWYPLEPDAWRADPARGGGGVLMDLGSHLLDLARWLAGPLTELRAVATQRAWATAVEDTSLVVGRHDSGAMSVLEVSFAVHGSDNACEVYGTRGWVRVTAAHGTTVARRIVAGQEEEIELPPVNVYAAELLDFSRALRSGEPTATTGEDGRANVADLARAYRSLREGGTFLGRDS